MTLAADRPPDATRRPLIERWWDFRDRLIRKPGFQRFAAAFPLTRPLARKRQVELFDLVGGFVYSQILFATVRLKLVEHLANGPRPLADLAGAMRLPLAAARRLLEATTALRLTTARSDGCFGLGDLGAALLGSPGVAAMVEHHAILYADLADPVALLADPARPTGLSQYWAYAATTAPGALDREAVGDYSRLMAVSQAFIAEEVLAAYPVRRHARLLDAGGGEGAFIVAAAARAPKTDFLLFDLPAVADRATARFAAAGLGARATAIGGDLFADALPGGADIVTLIRVLYDHETPRALAILRAARAALPKGGTLLVAEPMAGTRGAERMGAAYFGLYLLAMKGGQSRSAATLTDLIREAGFADARQLSTNSPMLTGLIVAKA